MPIRNRYRPGDHLVVCDRTGFTRYASETAKEWNGWRTWRRIWWPRQPQDLVRGLKDDMFVEDARPRGVSEFVGPLTTELSIDHAAGALTLNVTSSARFSPGDHLLIGLDNKDMFRGRVNLVPTATSILLLHPLTWSAAAGSTIIDTSAVAQSDLA